MLLKLLFSIYNFYYNVFKESLNTSNTMALRCLKLLRVVQGPSVIRHSLPSSSITFPVEKIAKPKQFRTEDNLIYLEDPDTFGTLSRSVKTQSETLEDEGDIKEEQFFKNIPLPSQKLTTRQYADLIKQYLKHKRLKEAIDVLEVRMIKEDRVKPENYIFNILIGACADVGYTKKAFKLYNNMKKRNLKPTGDTYTCLFHACANSPWAVDGLKNAIHLRELMIEKGIEPNLTNYNSMIKAFGRCGDLPTAFKIVDEMIEKKIKIRVHTFNHLLQACISDKHNGLRHALIIWRKMLKMREKPNIYSFNLMLKCVKDCNLGTKDDIEQLIGIIQQHIEQDSLWNKTLKLEPPVDSDRLGQKDILLLNESTMMSKDRKEIEINNETIPRIGKSCNNLTVIENNHNTIQFVDIHKEEKEGRVVPNLLSKVLQMQQVLSLQEIQTVQEKFAVIGGQEDFLKEMKVHSVKPDIKTFTQMLPLLEETTEAENKLLETMKSLDTKADIDFYNMLIKKRCLRSDYDAAFGVKEIIDKENKYRKKQYPLKKKLRLKANIMTYGVLALACQTKESAEKLLGEMKEAQLKVNIEILGTLLRQGTVHNRFEDITYIMNLVKQENIPVNCVFLKHLEGFNDKCAHIIKLHENGKAQCKNEFVKSYKHFINFYSKWLKECNIEEVLKPEHPWSQFTQTYPGTVQRQKIVIKQPRKFYKRNRTFVQYAPKM